jgi:hypothetical protein
MELNRLGLQPMFKKPWSRGGIRNIKEARTVDYNLV